MPKSPIAQSVETAAGSRPQSRSALGALACLSLSTLLPSLSISSANVALPTIAEAFGASFQQAQWIVLAYLLAITTLIVSVGRLGDIAGRRRLFLTGLIVFAAASALCGLTDSLWLLIAFRTAQGLGAAVLMALTMAFVGEATSKDKTGQAMGLLGTMSAIGTALGPSLGGALIAGPGWRAIFFINLPLCVIAIILTCLYLPADRPATRAGRSRLDHLGTALLALTLAAYALAMTIGRGDFGGVNLILLLASALGAGLFAKSQMTARSPLIHLATLREPSRNAGFAMNMLVSTVMMATLIVGPFYLSRSLGLNAAQIGLVMSVGPLAAALAGVPAGRAVDRFGAGRMTAIGLAAGVAGCIALSLLPIRFGAFGYIAPSVILTAGYALFQAANNTAVMTNIGSDQRGVISAMLNLSRNLGLITGASVMGAVFAAASGAVNVAAAAPDAVATGMRVTFGAAALLIALALCLAVGHGALASRRPVQESGL